MKEIRHVSPEVHAVRLLSLDIFKLSVRKIENTAANMITISSVRVEPGPGSDHVTWTIVIKTELL